MNFALTDWKRLSPGFKVILWKIIRSRHVQCVGRLWDVPVLPWQEGRGGENDIGRLCHICCQPRWGLFVLRIDMIADLYGWMRWIWRWIEVYSNHFGQGSMRSELSDLHSLVAPKHKLTGGIFNIFASLQQVIWSMQCDPSLIAISFIISISQSPKFYEPSDSSWKFVVLGGFWSYLKEVVKEKNSRR